MKRLEYIDIAKGIGIILVVFGHCVSTNSLIGRWIYSFHMPLFFFISGFCFDNNKHNHFLTLIQIKFKQLMLPYIYFVLIIIVLQSIINNEGSYFITFKIQFLKFILTGSLGALWFLPVLFFSEMLFFAVQKYLNKYKLIQIFTLIFFSILGAALSKQNISLPYALITIFSATFFYGLGNVLKNTIQNSIIYLTNGKITFGVITLLIISIIISMNINPPLSMASNRMEPYLFVYFGAFVGITLVILFSLFICESFKNILIFIKLESIFKYLGINTLLILALHMFYIELCSQFIKPLVSHYIIYKGFEQIFIWSLLIISIYIVNSWMPWLIGKKPLIEKPKSFIMK